MTRKLATLMAFGVLVGAPLLPAALAAQDVVRPDAARLLQPLSILAADSMEGRGAGTAGAERARAFLVRALRESGAAPLGDGYRHPFAWTGGEGVNLLGVVPGTRPDAYLVLTAHYDHEGVRGGEVYNGADDNASGVVAALEVARQAAARPLRHTLVVALLDAEEQGLRGARALVRDPPVPLDAVALNVNLDMVSRTEGVLWAAGAAHTPGLRPILERVAAAAPLELRLGHDRVGAPEGDDWTGASDHAAFHAVGIPFVYFGVEDHPDYHRPTDDVERVDPDELVDSVHTILMAVRALDGALPLGEWPPG